MRPASHVGRRGHTGWIQWANNMLCNVVIKACSFLYNELRLIRHCSGSDYPVSWETEQERARGGGKGQTVALLRMGRERETSRGPLCSPAQNKRKQPSGERVEKRFGWAGEKPLVVEPRERLNLPVWQKGRWISRLFPQSSLTLNRHRWQRLSEAQVKKQSKQWFPPFLPAGLTCWYK